MIDVCDIEFTYQDDDFGLRVEALSIESRTTTALLGPSGSGKTTLLHLMAGIIVPRTGRVSIDDTDLTRLPDAARRRFRIRNIGLVFQEFELLEYLGVLDNILLPYRMSFALQLDAEVRQRARKLAERVGLGDKLRRNVRRLSQGERQRVSICRALITRPRLVLADEPTGNLDPSNKQHVLDILFDCVHESKATLAMVTHDHDLLERFDRIIDIQEVNRWPAASDARHANGVTGS